MTPFQRSLDRYLTQEPPDDTWWFEKVSDYLTCSDELYQKFEKKIEKWMEYLFNKEYTPQDAALLIDKTIMNAKY